MLGFDVAPEVWIGAGKGVGAVSDELADGVGAFYRAVDRNPFGSDDLGRGLFEGDARSGAPGFAELRKGLLNDLAAAVNLLAGMGAGLVDAGGRYVETDGTIVDGLSGPRGLAPSPGTPVSRREYRLPGALDALPVTVPAPGFVRQAVWLFETVGLGFAWPDGDVAGVRALCEAAVTMERVLDRVTEGVAGHAGRVTGSGFGDATEAFGSAARVVHGEGGLLEDLRRRCGRLAAYCRSGADAIVAAQGHFIASASFVVTLMYATSIFGPLLETALWTLIRLEGLALQIVLRMIREAAMGAVFSGGLDAIDQWFRGGGFHARELVQALGQGVLAGGLMGGAHAGLPSLLRRGPALTALADAMESPGWKGLSSRFLTGGSVGTAALATAGAVSGNGWDWKHAAESGFGMAFVGAGAELIGGAHPGIPEALAARADTIGPSSPNAALLVVERAARTAEGLKTLLQASSDDLVAVRNLLEGDPDLARRLHSIAEESTGLSGNYNHNVRFGNLMVRSPILRSDRLDLRIFRESDVLSAIHPYLDGKAARLVYEGQGWSVHAFEEGRVLSDVAPPNEPVPQSVLHDMVDLFRRLADVPVQGLPLPADWPSDGDTAAYGRRLAMHTARVHATFRNQLDPVFGPLGVPEEPMASVLADMGNFTPRPFRLLHNDLHRGNIILRPDGRSVALDWELAVVGDPVSDLATHLHLMRYPKADEQAVLRGWAAEMPSELTQGWQPDLRTSRKYRQVQSAINDTIRDIQLLRQSELSFDERHEMIVRLTAVLNTAGRVWGWREPLSVDRVAAVTGAFP